MFAESPSGDTKGTMLRQSGGIACRDRQVSSVRQWRSTTGEMVEPIRMSEGVPDGVSPGPRPSPPDARGIPVRPGSCVAHGDRQLILLGLRPGWSSCHRPLLGGLRPACSGSRPAPSDAILRAPRRSRRSARTRGQALSAGACAPNPDRRRPPGDRIGGSETALSVQRTDRAAGVPPTAIA